MAILLEYRLSYHPEITCHQTILRSFGLVHLLKLSRCMGIHVYIIVALANVIWQVNIKYSTH